MKKTFSISIANTAFTIEDDAYALLEKYLDDVKIYFSEQQDVIKDIESRVAERLSELPHDIVTKTDVDAVIADMGTVDQFTDSSEESPKAAHPKKRLYRDTDTAMIAGVSSGLGHFFGIDPLIIRILFAISIFFGGAGAAIYVILWLLVPEAETAAQKLEMRGSPVTLSTMSAMAKEHFSKIPTGAARKMADKVQSKAFPLVRTLLSIVLLVLGIAAIVGSTVGFLAAVFFVPASVGTVGAWFYVAAVSGYLLALIPSFFIFLAGLRGVRQKPSLNRPSKAALVAVWFIAAILAGIGASRIAGDLQARYDEMSNQVLVTNVVEAGAFTKVEAYDNVRISYRQGDIQSVEARSSSAALERLQVSVTDNTLVVRRGPSERPCLLCEPAPVTVMIVAPNLESVAVHDASRFEAEPGTFKNLSVEATDASRVEMAGDAVTLKVIVKDASRFSGQNLSVRDAEIAASDASRAEITVSGMLRAFASDASSIRYAGNPTVDQRATDASSVRAISQESE